MLMVLWWARRDSNSHALLHMLLRHACIPIPPLARAKSTVYPCTRNTLLYCEKLLCMTREECSSAFCLGCSLCDLYPPVRNSHLRPWSSRRLRGRGRHDL